MIIICENCERGIDIPPHATTVTCSCGARYEVDLMGWEYKRVLRGAGK